MNEDELDELDELKAVEGARLIKATMPPYERGCDDSVILEFEGGLTLTIRGSWCNDGTGGLSFHLMEDEKLHDA